MRAPRRHCRGTRRKRLLALEGRLGRGCRRARLQRCGWQLASITHQKAQTFVEERFAGRTGSGIWIGLSDRQQESRFVWEGDDYSPFRHWDANQPDNHQDNEDCVELYPEAFAGHAGFWNDTACEELRPFLCEMERPEAQVSPLDGLSACHGPLLSEAEVLERFTASRTDLFAGFPLQARSRACDISTGCGPWSPVESAGHASAVLRLVDGQARLQLSLGGCGERETVCGPIATGATTCVDACSSPSSESEWSARVTRTCVGARSRRIQSSPGGAAWIESELGGLGRPPLLAAQRYWIDPDTGRGAYVSAQPLPFDAAAQACASHGAHLAVVRSVPQHLGISGILPSWAWLGGTDVASEGSFRWLNGEPFVFTAWTPGEPNNVRGKENCLEATPSAWVTSPLETWNDRDCADPRLYVCEY